MSSEKLAFVKECVDMYPSSTTSSILIAQRNGLKAVGRVPLIFDLEKTFT